MRARMAARLSAFWLGPIWAAAMRMMRGMVLGVWQLIPGRV